MTKNHVTLENIEQFDPGTVILPYMTHIYLSWLFDDRNGEGFYMSSTFIDSFLQFTRFAEAIVTAPHILCCDQVEDSILPKTLMPEVNFWTPFYDIPLVRKLLDPSIKRFRTAEIENTVSKEEIRIFYGIELPIWATLISADLFGFSIDLGRGSLGERTSNSFKKLLLSQDTIVRPPKESVASIVIKYVEEFRTSLFKEISRNFCFFQNN